MTVMDSATIAWVSLTVAVIGSLGSLGALFQWNHARNAERDRDRERLSNLEKDVLHLHEALQAEKISINAHLDRIYAKLDELVKAIYSIRGSATP